MEIFSKNTEVIKGISPYELESLKKDLSARLSFSSQELDCVFLTRAMVAKTIKSALDKGGEEMTRKVINSEIKFFRERYESGLNISTDLKKSADLLYSLTSDT
jgi:hypothetical protein